MLSLHARLGVLLSSHVGMFYQLLLTRFEGVLCCDWHYIVTTTNTTKETRVGT